MNIKKNKIKIKLYTIYAEYITNITNILIYYKKYEYDCGIHVTASIDDLITNDNARNGF